MRKTNFHVTDTYHYSCAYCAVDFVPKRRRVQKYCSNNCRSKAYHLRKNGSPLQGLSGGDTPPEKVSDPQIEKMSLVGIGNAAAGTAAVTILANLLTKEEHKPATKGDLKKIAQSLKRYHRIKNLEADLQGRLPYYDLDKEVLVYFFWMEVPEL